MNKPRKEKISTFGSQITSAISVALVLVLIGAMAMTMVLSHRLAEDIRKNIDIVVKVLPGATDEEIARVQQLVSDQPGIGNVTYSSPEKILEEESQLVGEDISAILDQNPFGGEFEASLLPSHAFADSIDRISAAIAVDPAVDEVVSQTEVVNNINSFLGRVSVVLLVVAIALLIVSFALINNTVSLAVYSRRFIIYTMKLVGATGAFIRKPFLLAGLVTGLVAAAAAIGCVAAIRVYAASVDSSVDSLLGWDAMAWIFALLLVAGPLICIAASAIATNRYLRADYDKMFR